MKTTKKPRSSKKPSTRTPTKAVKTSAKRPRGRPAKTRPDTPEAPETPPPPAEKPKILESLLLRLVSPLKSLPVQTNEAVVYIRPEDIAYITTVPAPKRGVLIVTIDGQEWRRFDSIKDLRLALAPDPRFFLSHKSYLVNVFAVRTLRKNPETKRQEVTFGDQVKSGAGVSAGNLKALRDLLEL